MARPERSTKRLEVRCSPIELENRQEFIPSWGLKVAVSPGVCVLSGLRKSEVASRTTFFDELVDGEYVLDQMLQELNSELSVIFRHVL